MKGTLINASVESRRILLGPDGGWLAPTCAEVPGAEA